MAGEKGAGMLAAKDVRIPCGEVELEGVLEIPERAQGVVVFAHGSGSSRHSPRNRYVARVLREAGHGTLLFDLLTAQEEIEDQFTGHLRFDIGFLAGRLWQTTKWLRHRAEVAGFGIGYFGSSTGAAAALVAAATNSVDSVVSRGGRPDLAGVALAEVRAPTLLIVGGWDEQVLELNQIAYEELRCEKRLSIVPGATHLFEEPGKLEEVAKLAADWFTGHLSLRQQT